MALLLWQRNRDALLLSAFTCGQFFYAGYVGGDWMPFGRFLLPAAPLLWVLLVWGLHALAQAAGERHSLARIPPALGSLALLAWVAMRLEPHHSAVPHQNGKRAHAAEQVRHVAALVEASAYLAAAVPTGGRMVTDYGGVLAYYTQSNPIEMWGLCNATIAVRGHTQGVQPIYGKTCPECYPELDPEFFHVTMPLVRTPEAFRRHVDVVRAVWQTDTIGRHMDIVGGFVSGRVVDRYRNRALWFLEKRGLRASYSPRNVGERFVVEYPFEVSGAGSDGASVHGRASSSQTASTRMEPASAGSSWTTGRPPTTRTLGSCAQAPAAGHPRPGYRDFRPDVSERTLYGWRTRSGCGWTDHDWAADPDPAARDVWAR
jgi:hypothetical protein